MTPSSIKAALEPVLQRCFLEVEDEDDIDDPRLLVWPPEKYGAELGEATITVQFSLGGKLWVTNDDCSCCSPTPDKAYKLQAELRELTMDEIVAGWHSIEGALIAINHELYEKVAAPRPPRKKKAAPRRR